MTSIQLQSIRNPLSSASENEVVNESVKVKLEWSNISYSVPVGDKENIEMKTILHPISGSAKPGELFAIMGTSGAGKVLHSKCLIYYVRVFSL